MPSAPCRRSNCASLRRVDHAYFMLQGIRLHNFRCYASLDWEPPERGALILGNNAQGKTSLLEGICFGLRLSSPRTSHTETLLKHGMRRFGVLLRTLSGTRRIVWEGGKLNLSLDDISCRDNTVFLSTSPSVVWFGNDDIELIRGNAEARRKHLDFLGFQWHPAYRKEWSFYRKTLKSRNFLLKQHNHSDSALRSYTELLATSGDRLVRMRHRLIGLLMPHLCTAYESIAGAGESPGMRYAPSTELPLEEALSASLEEDKRFGFTHFGPHRDDFKLLIRGVAALDFASEGQQRTLAVALQMAHASLLQEETGIPPVLLIDDIFGELDITRRRAFMASLPIDSPLFVTTTQDMWQSQAESSTLDRFLLKNGNLTRL